MPLKKAPFAEVGEGHISACWLHFQDSVLSNVQKNETAEENTLSGAESEEA